MANIRIKDLSPDATPNKNDILPIDALTTRGVTIENAVKIGRPFASQAEAEGGTDYTKAMNPLTTAQAIAAQGGAAFASAAQGMKADSAVQPGALSTVATSGAYADLTGKPTLGTAAATDATAYATAAQGATADSAVQPGSLATVATSGAYGDLSGKPTLGTAAATAATDYAPIAQAVPAGGTTGQVLAKSSNADNAVAWTAAGVGDMLGAANLSDLDNAATAVVNLGLGTPGTTGLAVLAATNVAEAFTALGTPLTANTMLVDNAAGTAREAKTFAQVRTALEVIPVGRLPYISGYWNGVVSTNTAAQNAVAIQAILNNPAYSQGGRIDIQGLIYFNQQINLTGKSNFCFGGQTQINSGAKTPSALLWNGSGTSAAILNAGMGNGFDHCDLYCSNPAFAGFLMDCSDSNNTHLNDMMFSLPATSGSAGILLNRTISTYFSRVNFAGWGDFVYGRSGTTANYANDVRFTECQFHPTGGTPIQAPHGGWHFEGGYAQVSPDGVGRFINGSASLPFQTLTIKNMLMSDANKSSIWMNNLYGVQLEISHCISGAGGTDGYGVFANLVGVIGAKIHQNDWRPYTNSRLVEMPNTGTTKFVRIEDNLVNVGYLVTPGTTLATHSVVLAGNYTSAGAAVTA